MSILRSNYWHGENLVIRKKWVFFVCKQIAFWFIRDAPLRTNCSRCCLCSQWLKGPTWISYERVTIAFNPVLYGTGMLLAEAAARLPEHRAWGLLINYTTFSWRSPHRHRVQEGLQLLPPCTGLATSWAAAPHSTTKMNPPILQTGFALERPPNRIFHPKIVMEIACSDERNPCYKYPGSGRPPFPAMHTHMHGD